ncbi:MAG: PIN domain-containing protein [Proteobacteria bacterium]|nr:PIN domain-containing protein [Pseudomonadota bacterium]
MTLLKHTIYLDVCCFNRPYDDQLQPLVRLETEAKLLIQGEVLKGNLCLVWSFILHYENNDNPFAHRKKQIALWETKAAKLVTFKPEKISHAERIMTLGIKAKDALHVACAIAANADYFITTDKRLLNKHVDGIVIINPMDFIRRYFDEN